jgi:hypothetical protein
LALVVGVIATRGVLYARDRSAFATDGERRFALIGEAIATRLPEDAVVLAMQHSGSIRYYSGREIIRYDLLPPQRLDRLLKRLRRVGRHPYLLLDDWEVPAFRERFEDRSAHGSLDWPPMLELEHVNVRVWDLAERRRRGPPAARSTEVLPWPYPR